MINDKNYVILNIVINVKLNYKMRCHFVKLNAKIIVIFSVLYALFIPHLFPIADADDAPVYGGRLLKC